MIEVRVLGPDDADHLAVACSVFREATTLARCRELLAEPSGLHLLARIDGEVAGWIVAWRIPRFRGTELFLYEIDTALPYRRRGVARALMAELLRLARAEGIETVFLLANADNAPAMALYAALGGRRTADDGVLWEWPLSGPAPE